MKTKLIILFAVMLMPMGMMAQGQVSLKELKALADNTFYAGDYVKARKQYQLIYADYDDSYAHSQMYKCADCVSYITEAANAERDGNYDKAIAEYKKVRLLNPKDPKIQGFIDSCQERQYGSLLADSRLLFKEGRYQEARTKLEEYTSKSGKTDVGLLSSITEYLTWQTEARNAFDNKDYTTAKSYYNRIISANPTDAISATAIAEINRLSTSTQTVYIEKKDKKFALKPTKNGFSLYMYSGFSSPVDLGGGIGYNISFFQMNFDIGGPNDDEKEFEFYEDGYYSRYKTMTLKPKLSVIFTPGLNLKYFSIGFGVGATIADKNLRQKNSYDYESKNESYFTMRPSFTGNIPLNKKFSGGLIVMLGYNIVSGQSDLNQLVAGVGFFF